MKETLLIFGAGLVAGTMNSAAGGGSFVTLPALMFTGMPSPYANATSTVALFPGSVAGAWASREECQRFTGAPMKAMVWTSLIGGLIGAILLYTTPSATFDTQVPWLLLAGTVAFALGPRAGRRLRSITGVGPIPLLAGQGLLGVYAGYFGGAAGIMMMALWHVLGVTDTKAMNAAKTLLVGVANASAVLCFALTGLVWWSQVCAMVGGAILGGYGGARLARRMDPCYLRNGITVFNVVLTVVFFWRSILFKS